MNNIERLFDIFKELEKEERDKISVEIVAHMFGYFSCEKSDENPITLERFEKLIEKTMKL
ncbi:hypothetical protein [Clostridium lacusfryxellense]|uniref:hypothetical protein n=1 Tax=Clostridium lacusfryxellense TaxID=205328 RepID=UPI001C0C3E11|nr:hypothetical protein [Clostridium lacusfryxellense]MBU3114785.1 hypothetical protein [Clostridium lacusfryxellense]